MELHYDILDNQRRAFLPLFADIRNRGFYLAGGTALALLLGHRDSIDFDFFSQNTFDTSALFSYLEQHFAGHSIVKTQEEVGTLSLLVDDTIRVSFLHFPYPLAQPLINTEYFDIASLDDIACMKLSAITGRTAFKDYVDLYFILERTPLKEIIATLRQKMPTLDPLLALKSLIYFDDLTEEAIIFKTTPVSFDEIKKRLTAAVAEYPRI